MNKIQASKINDIEALRAIAVLITIADHFGSLFTWGNDTLHKIDIYFGFWTGVDLFFAISGFVIARDLLVRLSAPDRGSHSGGLRLPSGSDVSTASGPLHIYG